MTPRDRPQARKVVTEDQAKEIMDDIDRTIEGRGPGRRRLF